MAGPSGLGESDDLGAAAAMDDEFAMIEADRRQFRVR